MVDNRERPERNNINKELSHLCILLKTYVLGRSYRCMRSAGGGGSSPLQSTKQLGRASKPSTKSEKIQISKNLIRRKFNNIKSLVKIWTFVAAVYHCHLPYYPYYPYHQDPYWYSF